jgi:hypothetical protein
MTIREWFHQLFNFVTIIRRLEAENLALMERVSRLQEKNDDFDAAVSTLSHAIVYITTPPEEKEEPVLKPVRFQRRTYAEEAKFIERQWSARFRDQDAAKRRKDQAATR